MNPRLMGEGIASHHSLVFGNRKTRKTRNHFRSIDGFLENDGALDLVVILTDIKGYSHFFQGCIPCPLTDPIDGALHPACSIFDGRKGIGHSHA